jgi:hypothetical protein
MQLKKKELQEIVLINIEGPILKLKRAEDDNYVLYDKEDSIVDILSYKKVIDFIFNKMPLTYTDGKQILYTDFNPKDRANRGELARFLFGKGVATGFLEFSKENGQWLSPVPEEREWQEDVLKELFPSYPNAAPKWQYLNGLLQIALRYKEGIEIDPEVNNNSEELEDDENG